MASFAVHGLDELSADFRKAGKVPSEVTKGMLRAMAEKAKAAQEKMAAAMLRGPYATGTTPSVLKINTPRTNNTGGKISITFSGARTRGKTTTRNAAIAFIDELGKKNQPARPFIKTANEQSGEEINEAGAAVFYKWLDSNGL